MQRKAALADRTRPGLPILDADTVEVAWRADRTHVPGDVRGRRGPARSRAELARVAALDARLEGLARQAADALAGETRGALQREAARCESAVGEKTSLAQPSAQRPPRAPEAWRVRIDVLEAERAKAQERVEVAGRERGAAETDAQTRRAAPVEGVRAWETARAALSTHRAHHGSDEDLSLGAAGTAAERDRARAAWHVLEGEREMAEEAREARAQGLRDGLREALERQREVQRLEAQIESLRRRDPEGRLAGLLAERADLAPRVRAARVEADALLLLEESVAAEKDRVRLAVGEPIRERVERWLRYLLQDDSAVAVGDDGRPRVIRTPAGQEVPYADRSFGTREQVSVLYRLAVADLVAREGKGVCLVLDDPFGHTDRGRRARMLEILEAEVRRRGHQVLVFTCRPEDFEGAGTHVTLARA